jgi:hypothetical protein
MRFNGLRAVLALLVLATSWTAHATREFSGQTPSGANYRIQVPDSWTPGDGLVIHNHGFSMSAVANNMQPDLGPLLELHLAQDFAVAASSYSQRGWALFSAKRDNRELYEAVVAEIGEPGFVYMFGGSLGGLISLKTAELDAGIPGVRGVLSVCPAVAGARTWDSAFDLRLAYDVVCEGVGGGELPLGSEPWTWALDFADIPPDLGDLEDQDDLESVLRAAARINQCTGVSLPPALRSDGMQARLDRLKDFAGIGDEDWLVINLGYSIFGLSDVLRAPEKMANRNPFDNRFVVYEDAEIQTAIARVERDRIAALDFKHVSTPNGDIGNAKVFALHTSRDELVVPEHLKSLPDVIDPEQLYYAYVDEETAEHCDFTTAEGVTTWQAFRAWVEEDQRPEPTDMQIYCQFLVDVNDVDGPCRFLGNFEPRPLDERLRPRNLAQITLGGFQTGSWYDPDRAGEGWVVEPLGNDRALVYWFTYPPEGGDGEQAWIGGVGRIIDDGIVIDDAFITRGARFGDAFDPAQVELEAWGKLRMVFYPDPANPSRNVAKVRYEGPEGWGTAERDLVQLTHARVSAETLELDPPPPEASDARYSGGWFDTARQGEGFFMHVESEHGRAFVWWFTYDNAGNQAWITGDGTVSADGRSVVFPPESLVITRGTRFGDALDPDAVQRIPFGELRFEFDDCMSGTAQATPILDGFDPVSYQLTRLTIPVGLGGCNPL